MRAINLLSLVLFISISTSCLKENTKKVSNIHDQYFVDRIFDYNNRLIAEYFYNDCNKLVKRSCYDPVNYPNIKTIDTEFEYENGRIKNIKTINYTHPQFNHNIIVFYNEQGKIIRDETYHLENLVDYKNYFYLPNGSIKSIYYDNGEENFFVNYNYTANALQVKVITCDSGDIGSNKDLIENYRNFDYDNKLKPNFGIANIFQWEPIPYFGDEATFEKNISKNNMTEFMESGTKWIFTYNEYNLPSTIETKWKDIETIEPMLIRIQYKKIE